MRPLDAALGLGFGGSGWEADGREFGWDLEGRYDALLSHRKNQEYEEAAFFKSDERHTTYYTVATAKLEIALLLMLSSEENRICKSQS
mmetsp:Transcript_24292/g.28621  ORF Transcript_24292/g.28621 Transcript_24292/m.28621 type:complete len:88 (-) Transcript_24292:213-476(-)